MQLVNDLFNQRLIATGGGTFLGMILSVMLVDPAQEISPGFAKELASGSLVVVGSLLMAQRDNNLTNIGLGLGSAGTAILARSLFDRFTHSKPANGNGNGNGEETSGENGHSDWFDEYEVI